MKKLIMVMLCICMLAFAGCSNTDTETDVPKIETTTSDEAEETTETENRGAELQSYGLTPYERTQEERDLMMILHRSASLFSYNIPDEAKAINIKVYSFNGSEWEKTLDSGFGISDDEDKNSRIAVTENDDKSIRVTGRLFLSTSEPPFILKDEDKINSVSKQFLEETWEYEPNTEIPLYMTMGNEDGVLIDYNLSDFPSTENLENVGYIEIMTIEFPGEIVLN